MNCVDDGIISCGSAKAQATEKIGTVKSVGLKR